MRISDINEEHILFDNGNEITFCHCADCCEWNYADFAQLDDIARLHDFDTQLQFEAVDGAGFRFGDNQAMFFVPCYSEQNGYYSSDVDIYYNGNAVLNVEAEMSYDLF